jgi:hypothetical protein
VDAFRAEYNTDRPHQSLDRASRLTVHAAPTR